jgi:hypothetical protein
MSVRTGTLLGRFVLPGNSRKDKTGTIQDRIWQNSEHGTCVSKGVTVVYPISLDDCVSSPFLFASFTV